MRNRPNVNVLMTKSNFKTKIDGLSARFRDTFRELSADLMKKLEDEKAANEQNFDSGYPLESYFRQEFGKYIPKNFSIDAGRVIDAKGYSAGDCDFVIFDEKFAPFIRFPITPNDRRKYIAFETTYGIVEVKQNLTKASLREACHKIFAYKQLEREEHNRPDAFLTWERVNPPFGIIFSYSTDFSFSTEKDVREFENIFLDIHKDVDVNEYVNGIFILSGYSISWYGKASERQKYKLAGVNDIVQQPFPEYSAGEPEVMVWVTFPDTLFLMSKFVWECLMSIQLLPVSFQTYYKPLFDEL